MKTSDTIQAGLILGCGVVTTGAGTALLVGRQATGSPLLEDALGLALAGLGLTVVGGWVLLFLVALLAELLQRRGPSIAATCASRCAPALMRRLAVALLGLNLLAVPAVAHAATAGTAGSQGPAAAATTGAATTGAATTGTAGSAGQAPSTASRSTSTATPGPVDPTPEPVSPAWQPEPLPVDGGPLVRGPSRAVVDAEEAVVAPGDSLWSIVAARLGPLATAADIAEVWPTWYEANRALIGDDPSLLLPGTVLQAPSA
ncbi:LysM peptidoglycan-binding domain-containing protein [Arthrobacter pityocampae]|uniref:LysM peptidoglycan-binding domain-containing protein n=1 Tax=Arthrobacter pityocampae TaxID=547334 RepID=UPI0037368B7D